MIYRHLYLGCMAAISFINYASSGNFPYVYPRIELGPKTSGKAGEPLFLTPYIERGDILFAQNKSRVSITENIGFTSHSGFFTVDPKFNSNLYFWYFPAFSKNKLAPIILWLQGGPGGSSLFGLFTENGPLLIDKNGFSVRKYHWALNSHLIYIDNPVGTGFSFTDGKGYCEDQVCIANGLYSCLKQFLTLFPKLQNNEVYITGESYAGKYIPSLAMEIHVQNKNNNFKINLQGLAMGNAYCDPINQLDYGRYLYQHGLLDDKQKELFTKLQLEIVKEIQSENWLKADMLMDKLMDGDLTNFSYFKNYTGFNTYYNFLETTDNTDISMFLNVLHNDTIRNSVHVGGLPFNSGEEVQLHLVSDILKSVAPLVAELLSYYRILLYNGQLDIIVAYPLTENFVRHLNFTAADIYKAAPRHIWKVGSDIAGYYKKAGNLTEVLVRNSGHMVPHDQPKWALDLITKFIKGKM